jgi:hypothetical protein
MEGTQFGQFADATSCYLKTCSQRPLLFSGDTSRVKLDPVDDYEVVYEVAHEDKSLTNGRCATANGRITHLRAVEGLPNSSDCTNPWQDQGVAL